jgi:hypothetical protein
MDGQSDTIRTVTFTLSQQLRSPELLSVTCRYTSPQRHPLLWEKQVIIYIQYHKGQPQSGHSKDSVRSLRCAIKTSSWTTFHTSCIFTNCPSANVLPALSFLHNPRPRPRAQSSQIGHCLRVCARPAPVPCCHGRAREIGDGSRSPSVSKSSPPKTRPTYFELGDVEAADVGEELDIVATAEQGNHSDTTFK